MDGQEPIDQEKRADRPSNGNSNRPQPDDEDRPRLWRRPSRTQAFWIFFVLVLIFAAKFFDSRPSDAEVISYKTYREHLEAGLIASAVIIGENELHGKLHNQEKFVVNLGPIDADTKREW